MEPDNLENGGTGEGRDRDQREPYRSAAQEIINFWNRRIPGASKKPVIDNSIIPMLGRLLSPQGERVKSGRQVNYDMDENVRRELERVLREGDVGNCADFLGKLRVRKKEGDGDQGGETWTIAKKEEGGGSEQG